MDILLFCKMNVFTCFGCLHINMDKLSLDMEYYFQPYTEHLIPMTFPCFFLLFFLFSHEPLLFLVFFIFDGLQISFSDQQLFYLFVYYCQIANIYAYLVCIANGFETLEAFLFMLLSREKQCILDFPSEILFICLHSQQRNGSDKEDRESLLYQ